MLRKLLDYKLSFFDEGTPLHKLRPLATAGDTFFYEPPINTHTGPHIRDAVDLKRWMIMVIFALVPCVLMAIWNTGLQKLVYTSGDFHLMNEYLSASTSFQSYKDFVFANNRWLTILGLGAAAFVPVMVISYAVGGLWEALFAVIRKHEIAEGFLVTGMLYPLVLPATIPYWMVAVGVSAGVVIGKELFGGTGMNILNPALTARCFLFFTFPNKMSGDVWAGTNPVHVAQSLSQMNSESGVASLDGYTQATPLGVFNVSTDIKRVHVDAIAMNNVGNQVETSSVIEKHFSRWQASSGNTDAVLGQLSPEHMQQFVTSSPGAGGLGLATENYQAAYDFAGLQYGIGQHTDANFFFGNMLGSMGETSVFACLLGALFLIYVGVGSWRSMVATGLGAFITAALFVWGAKSLGVDGGAWNPAKYAFPAYKHLIIGGLAFGLVFMATDPVSSPSRDRSKWYYGILIGVMVVVIRAVNPAFPEGTMLAILFANCFAPLIDYYVVRNYRRRHRVQTV